MVREVKNKYVTVNSKGLVRCRARGKGREVYTIIEAVSKKTKQKISTGLTTGKNSGNHSKQRGNPKRQSDRSDCRYCFEQALMHGKAFRHIHYKRCRQRKEEIHG